MFQLPRRHQVFAFALFFFGSATVARAEQPSVLASASSVELHSNGYSVSLSSNDELPAPRRKEDRHGFLKGWDHLYDLLADEGVEPLTLVRAFSDSRMPSYEPLYYSLTPREPSAMYLRLNTPQNRNHALAFYREHADSFGEAERRFGVPASIILALIQIETSCGQNTGSYRIFPRLARLAAAAAPENVKENYLRKQGPLRLIHYDRYAERAAYLENTFLVHTAAAFTVAKHQRMDVLDLRGSSAGAMGMPQFLPGNIAQFGVDGDGNGTVNIFSPADSILSVGNFLHSYGWSERPMTLAQKRDVLHHYNRSEPYVSTALAMADALQASISPAPKKVPAKVLRTR